MNKKKLFIFIILILFFISIYANISVCATTLVFTYNDKEYLISYEADDTAASYNGPIFEEDFGRIIFSDMVLTIDVDNLSYIIGSNSEEAIFYLDDLDDVKDYQDFKYGLMNACMNDDFYNIYNSKNTFSEDINDEYYDVNLSLSANKSILNQIYNAFIMNAMQEIDDGFEYLWSHDIEVLNILKEDYLSFGNNISSLNEYASSLSYSSFSDMIDDYNNKVSFDMLKDEDVSKLSRLIRAHDDEEIYYTFEEATIEISDLVYEKCFNSRNTYLDSLKEELSEAYSRAEEMILLFQAKERFRNYFNEFRENLDYNLYDYLDEINVIINEASIELENINYHQDVYDLKDEVLNKINSLKTKTISTYNGEIEASNGVSIDASLTIKKAKNEDFSEAAYDINIQGDDTSSQSYKVSIYDVELKHDEIDVYIINNKGIKKRLESTYENNVLTIETDTLGKVYVVRKKDAPWGQMAIVFGSLFIVSAITIIFLNRGKKDEE